MDFSILGQLAQIWELDPNSQKKDNILLTITHFQNGLIKHKTVMRTEPIWAFPILS